MNRKIIALSIIVLFFAAGFLYMNSDKLAAENTSTKKCCVDQSTSTTKKDVKDGIQYSSYQFTTDKACCNEMKSSLQKELMGVNGVKEVKFSPTCTASKMTMVTVYYSTSETNENQLASTLKDKKIDCPSMPGCDHEGCSKDKSSNNSGGHMECPKGGCDHKNKKTDGKNI